MYIRGNKYRKTYNLDRTMGTDHAASLEENGMKIQLK